MTKSTIQHTMGDEIAATLKGAGLNHPGAHKLQYYFYFKDRIAAEKLSGLLTQDGFDCEVDRSAQGESWLCLAKRSSEIQVELLNELGKRFSTLASELEGEFDGWERAPDEGDKIHPALAMMNALNYYKQGNYAEAIVLFKQVAESPSELGKLIWPQIGLAYCKLQQWEDAAQAFRQGLENRPDDDQTRTNLGATLHKLGKFEEAIELYKTTIKASPNQATAHYNLGCSYAKMGLPADALGSLSKAISLEKRFRELARSEPSFDSLRHLPDFEKLTRGALVRFMSRFGLLRG